MNMKTLLSLSLLALPFFAAQANAEPVTLNAQTQPTATAVKRLFRLPHKLKNKHWHKLKSLQIQQMLI